MNNLDLDFLADVELVEAPKTAKASAAFGGPNNGADLRLYKSGKVYPSVAFAEEFSLEYVAKGCKTDNAGRVPMGIDIIDSSIWVNYPKMAKTQLVFVMFTPKASAKVDLFTSTHYSKEDGISPVSSVLTQGGSKGAEALVKVVTELYGDVFGEEKYVDLLVRRRNPLVLSTGIYHLPKVMSKGKSAGTLTYVRRETEQGAFPLTVFIDPNAVKEEVKKEEVANAPVEEAKAEAIVEEQGTLPLTSEEVCEKSVEAEKIVPMEKDEIIDENPFDFSSEEAVEEEVDFSVAPVEVPEAAIVNNKVVNEAEILSAVGNNTFEQAVDKQ